MTKDTETSDAQEMAAKLEEYLEWLLVADFAERTIKNNSRNMGYFISWCEDRGITMPIEVTRPVLEKYQKWLYYYRKQDGEPLTIRSRHVRLSAVRSFFKWLAKNKHIIYNPASELELPKLEKRLPKDVLSENEAAKIMNQPDIKVPLGIRDRAILETLYSTGMRRKEIVRLKTIDLDMERGTVMVRLGKGKKDRMIPIGEQAISWINKYQDDIRPSLVVDPDKGILFLTVHGEPLTVKYLTHMVSSYIAKAKVNKSGSCHLFRHTMATLMLEHGADIRFIQEMLGHAELSSTQIYTRVSIRKLKEIHTQTHPSAQFKSQKK